MHYFHLGLNSAHPELMGLFSPNPSVSRFTNCWLLSPGSQAHNSTHILGHKPWGQEWEEQFSHSLSLVNISQRLCFLSLGRHIGVDVITSSESLAPEWLQQSPEPSSFPPCPISNTICRFICLGHYLSYIATIPSSDTLNILKCSEEIWANSPGKHGYHSWMYTQLWYSFLL